MADDFASRYPRINRFVFEHGWIEFGFDNFSHSFIRALDLGGLIWEGQESYNSLDEAFADLERGLGQWANETWGTDDE